MTRYTLIGLLLVLSVYCKLGSCIIGYDCTSNYINITAVSLSDVHECRGKISKFIQSDTYVQVIQIRNFAHIPYTSCLISYSDHLTHCGMHSHSAEAFRGFHIGRIHEISQRDCLNLHLTGTFKTSYGNIINNIPINKTDYRSVLEKGYIRADGYCEGSNFDYNGVWYTDHLLQRSYTITLRSGISIVDLENSNIKLPSGYGFSLSSNSGFDPDFGCTFWDHQILKQDCNKEKLGLIYQGPAVIFESYDHTKTLVVNSTKQIMAITLTTAEVVCYQNGYSTDHPKIRVIISTNNRFPLNLEPISAEDVDIFLYLNSKFIYMDRHLSNEMSLLYQNLEFKVCENRHQILNQLISIAHIDPDEFAWAYMKQPGYTALTRGEAIYVFRCTPVYTMYRPVPQVCFQELPVQYNNESFFIKPRSRILVKTGTEIDCNPLAPPLFKLDANWYEILGNLHHGKDPLQLTADTHLEWEYSSTSSLVTKGLYSYDQIQTYQKKLIFNIEKPAISNTIANDITGNTAQGIGTSLRYDNLITHQGVERLSKSIMSTLTDGITTFGTWMSFITGILIIISVIKFIVNSLINGTLLYRTFGCGFQLLTSVWGTLAKHLLYFRIINNNLSKDGSNEESAPMNDQQSTSESLYPKLDSTTHPETVVVTPPQIMSLKSRYV